MAEQIGTIKELKAIESGTSKAGKNWQKRTVLIGFTTGSGQYTKDVVAPFTFFGKVVDETGKYVEGEQVKVVYEIDSREYNGRYYIDLAAYKIELIGEKKSSVANAPTRTQSAAEPLPDDSQPLPF